MEIKLIRLLATSSPLTISEIKAYLPQSSLATLNLIAKFNQLEPGLILQHNGRYTLARKLDWLNESDLRELLHQHKLAYQVTILDQVDSTNSHVLQHIAQFPHQSLLGCNWQSAGRGRFGRTWLARIAADITLSYVYILPLQFNLALLPAICAVAINRLLKNHSLSNQIKWPNDIYRQKQKVAGVLVENVVRNQHNHVVIGIGLDNFAQLARNKLVADLTLSLDAVLQEFNLFGFALLRREWLDNCLHLHKTVIIKQAGVEIARGIHKDLGSDGQLIIESSSTLKSFSSSAISLVIADV